MTDRGEEIDTADRRLIREAKEEAWHHRRKLRRELPAPSGDTKHELACALDDYRDLLADYRDEDALRDEWPERDPHPDEIQRVLAETVSVEERIGYRRGATQSREVPLAYEVDWTWLLAVADELDAIAKELGFAAKPDESTHRTKIDAELIEEVEEWRKQNLAD